MLPSRFRLKLPPKWNRNFPDLKTNTPFFKIICKKVEGNQNPRVGFVISTKVAKAVERNRIRRKLETLLLPTLSSSKAPLEVVIIAYPKLSEANHEEISSSLNQALSKIHIK